MRRRIRNASRRGLFPMTEKLLTRVQRTCERRRRRAHLSQDEHRLGRFRRTQLAKHTVPMLFQTANQWAPNRPSCPRQQNSDLENLANQGSLGHCFCIRDEYGEQLGRFSSARIATDQMMCSRHLIPALTRPVYSFELTFYLAHDLTRDDVGIDERRMTVRC
jgi:hypothetical protein